MKKIVLLILILITLNSAHASKRERSTTLRACMIHGYIYQVRPIALECETSNIFYDIIIKYYDHPPLVTFWSGAGYSFAPDPRLFPEFYHESSFYILAIRPHDPDCFESHPL